MKIVILLLMLCLGSGAVQADVAGTFNLTRLEANLWRASFCFDTAVEILGFERPIRGMRKNHWRAATPGLLLTHTETTAQLESKDGKPFMCGAVEMDTYTQIPEKNYMAFSPFSDGGMSVYTGYLTGAVYRGGKWHEYDLKATYAGLPGEQVITRNPNVLDHQFVYFGKQQIKQTPEAVLIVDPEMPAAARDMLLSAMPKANMLLKELFGFTPNERYQVFMAAGELYSSSSDHTKGGTHPYQILYTMKGEGAARWAKSSPTYFVKFAMHEMLHLWQNEVWLGQLGEDQSWVHEGGADALAYEFMRLTGAYSPDQYAHVWNSSERHCLKYLGSTSVYDAPSKGQFDAVYQCGALVNRLVGTAINKEDPGAGMLQFWQAMTSWDRTTVLANPSEELYFRTLVEKFDFSPKKISAIRDFLSTRPEDPAKSLKRTRAALFSG